MDPTIPQIKQVNNSMSRTSRIARVMRFEPMEERIVFDAVPDFGLVDVNATSSTYESVVSPRDYEGQISGWYFGHST
jgi:hypothetical protein